MENTEFFDAGIEEVNSAIKLITEQRKNIDKELNKLKAELKRKETAKALYFGEKKKIKAKKEKKPEKKEIENVQEEIDEEEIKVDDSE